MPNFQYVALFRLFGVLKIPRLNGRPGSTPGTRTINKKAHLRMGFFFAC